MSAVDSAPRGKARALKVALGRRSHTRSLESGDVPLVGLDVEFVTVPVVNHAFRRMVRALEYDVCEMSFATYLCAREHCVPLVGIPVFLMRGLAHVAMARAREGGVSEPQDLTGRRVGTHNGFTATTGVWAREILASEYGVDLSSVTWVRAADEHVADYQPPPNVTSLQTRAPMADALASGELLAAVGAAFRHPAVVPLIPDAERTGLRAARERDFYPVNHLVVVRSDLLDRDPDLAVRLFDAFAAAKRQWLDQLRADALVDPTPADLLYRKVMGCLDDDPLPYGLEANRAIIERLITTSLAQGVITAPVTVDDLFAAPTLELGG